MIGRTLGNYRITEQIGMGGMATVYKAYDPGTDRYVALKVLPDYYSQDPKFRQRFEREAKAIAKLEHLHILPVHAYGEDGNTAYLVMRYMVTGTLRERIQAGPMPLAEVSRLLKQIASALDYAHQNGVLHRDVKPSNVLLDGESNAYLTDFGIAKMVEGASELTGSGIIGTPQYMSPEQCQGRKDLTGATDIYSLGVMLYEMIAGRTPYQAETPLAIIHMQLTGAALPPPRSLRPDLPEEAEAVILKALAAEPGERWPTCGAMADAFARVIAAEETATRPAPSHDTTKREIPTQKIAPEEDLDTMMPAPTEFEEDLSATMPAAVPVDADFATTAPIAAQSQPAWRRLPRWGWAMIGGLAVVVVLVLVGVGLVAGLLGTSQRPPAQQTPMPPIETPAGSGGAPKKVTITWWHLQTTAEHEAVWQKLADEYMAAHPNVTIEITVMENDPFKANIDTVMQSGEPPDIFQSWGGGTMNEYANAGLLKDITADLDADGGAWRNTFAPGALAVYSYKGRNYGVSWDMGMVGWWYNKALFAKAGITDAPPTWAEFLGDVKKLKAAGITPIALGEKDKWPGMHMWAYLVTRIGGKANFESASLRTGSFTDAPFVQAGEKLQELIGLQPFQDGFLDATYNDEAAAMGNGNAAMELMGQWAPAVMAGNSADGKGIGDNLGWFPFPMVEGGAGDPNDAVGGGNGFAIGKNASPEAIDFVKYLTRAESQVQLAQISAAIPVVKGGEAGLTDPLMITIQKSLALAKYFQLYYDQALPSAMGSVVNDSVWGIFAGTLTPEQAAQAIEDSAKQEIK